MGHKSITYKLDEKSYEEFKSIAETQGITVEELSRDLALELIEDIELAKEVQESLNEFRKGRTYSLEEVLEELDI